ncbi:siderophore-interacting protein [Paracoccus aerodenitrificans]|uniref:siderophore-interacting protein n=1 Tax=Paracoccus aerodenitrificans TaxID=3017781 RepID=UPI0022EFDC2E|nr:siderophore-interacting protein [Paracoccus aerodenitrificans]WBU63017.1 siderophore-interacting protein [Paracoccus aerodenitrificans]
MRHDPLPPFQAEAPLQVEFGRLDTILRRQAEEFGLELHSGHGRSTWLKLGNGEIGARRSGAFSVAYVRAATNEWLFSLKETVAYYAAELLAEPDLALAWSGPDQAGQTPPNFSLARVASVRKIGAHFQRLRIEGERLDRFDRDMIHFRLIPPHPLHKTEWPHLSARGQTVWPQELHRPAYTVSAIDAVAGWMETDIFVHEGGRICGFADKAATGAELGLMGPGGGGIPVAARLLIAGDETAYPALSRIIAAQAQDTLIVCHLFGASADYPFADHPGLRLEHSPAGETELTQRLEAGEVSADRVWIATERSRLQPLKAAVNLRWPKDRTHLAAYWNAAAGQFDSVA